MPKKKQPDIELVDPNDFADNPPNTDEGEIVTGPNPPGQQKGKTRSGRRKPEKDTIPQIGSIEDSERPLDED